MNDSKTQIGCEFQYEDGKRHKAFISNTEEGNPDWKEVIDTFGIEYLDKVTQKHLDDIKQKRDFENQRRKEMQETRANEMLFNAKLEAFSIEEVKNSLNRDLKSKIRRAKNIVEINAFTTLLILKEYELKEKETQKVDASEQQIEDVKKIQVESNVEETKQKSVESHTEKKPRKSRKPKKSDEE